MSDKSVRKVLDWPNHRVGSKPSDPIRFEQEEEGSAFDALDAYKKGPRECFTCGHPLDDEGHCSYCDEFLTDENKSEDGINPDEIEQQVAMSSDLDCPKCGFGWAIMPDEIAEAKKAGKWVCDKCGYEYPVTDEEDMFDLIFGPDEGDVYETWDDEEENKVEQGYEPESQELGGETEAPSVDTSPSLQLNPTSEQNVNPYTEDQFVPTGSQVRYPAPKKEEDYHVKCPLCGILFQDWMVHWKGHHYLDMTSHEFREKLGLDKESWGDLKEEVGMYQNEWEAGTDLTAPEMNQPMQTPQWQGMAPAGKGEGTDADELDDCGEDCCPVYCECMDCGVCQQPEDRYEEELRDPREPEDETELSPEAQKIAGTDEASAQAKEKSKPKIEVDVSGKITVLGASGSGKTNLIKVLMSDILKDYYFVLLDSIGNFAEYEGKENIEYHQVSPQDTAGVDEIIYAALERGDCMVVVDEVDRYETKKGTMLNELVNLGRNYDVGGIFAARRTADVDKDILANSPYIFTFQHILPQDLDVLMDWFAQPEQLFRDLQQYEAILFKNGEQAWIGKVPEKPTTTPSKPPSPPKKPKGKSKDKGKEPPTPKGGERGGQEPPEEEDPKEKGTPKKPMTEPEDEGEEAPPEEEPEEEGEAMKEEGAFLCNYCGKSFKYASDLEDHIVKHSQGGG